MFTQKLYTFQATERFSQHETFTNSRGAANEHIFTLVQVTLNQCNFVSVYRVNLFMLFFVFNYSNERIHRG